MIQMWYYKIINDWHILTFFLSHTTEEDSSLATQFILNNHPLRKVFPLH